MKDLTRRGCHLRLTIVLTSDPRRLCHSCETSSLGPKRLPSTIKLLVPFGAAAFVHCCCTASTRGRPTGHDLCMVPAAASQWALLQGPTDRRKQRQLTCLLGRTPCSGESDAGVEPNSTRPSRRRSVARGRYSGEDLPFRLLLEAARSLGDSWSARRVSSTCRAAAVTRLATWVRRAKSPWVGGVHRSRLCRMSGYWHSRSMGLSMNVFMSRPRQSRAALASSRKVQNVEFEHKCRWMTTIAVG